MIAALFSTYPFPRGVKSDLLEVLLPAALLGYVLDYAMAKDGLFFRPASIVSPSSRVPSYALLFQGIWISTLTLTGTYSQLLDYVVFAALVFYVLTILSLFALRLRRPPLERPYRAWGYPVVPAMYLIAASLIAVILLVVKPVYTFAGLFIVLLGISVYFLCRGARLTTSIGART